MKICAACNEDLPKESYSKKQWKLDEYQRRCKVCITNNREVQQQPIQDNDPNTDEVIKSLDSMYLKNIDEKISDEELFKQPPSQFGDCPICFLLLPELCTGSKYKSCCGKTICSGCYYAPVYDNQGNKVDDEKCPFCRSPTSDTDEEEYIERLNKRMEAGDAEAIHTLGYYYSEGLDGYPKDHKKALELYYRAAELGYAEAYCNIGYAYDHGEGMEKDEKKANHYYEIAAIKGNADARYNLATTEKKAGNMNRALKHYMIAVAIGDSVSLTRVKELYSKGEATKEDYTTALRSYQEYLDEIKSSHRDEAAAADEDNRYY